MPLLLASEPEVLLTKKKGCELMFLFLFLTFCSFVFKNSFSEVMKDEGKQWI